MHVSLANGLTYGRSAQRLDVYHPDRPAAASGTRPVVLLWHGRGPDERDVLAPVARAAAALGVVCFVPDWRPDAQDAGRAHLCESAQFVQRHAADFGGDPSRITLAGWSLGGKTAVGAALDPAALDGWRPHAVVSIAGGYMTPDPLTGRAAMDRLAGPDTLPPPIPIHLIHGTADAVVDVLQARHLAAALRDRHWPTALDELDADHAGVVMTVYDPETRRCGPTDADPVLRAGTRTAQLIAAAAS